MWSSSKEKRNNLYTVSLFLLPCVRFFAFEWHEESSWWCDEGVESVPFCNTLQKHVVELIGDAGDFDSNAEMNQFRLRF